MLTYWRHCTTTNTTIAGPIVVVEQHGEEEEEDAEEADIEPVSARPRRMSELSIKKTKKPIPKGSAFFIFSYNNR